MFSEFLKTHPLGACLPDRLPPIFPPASDIAAWSALPEARRAQVRALAERYRDEPYAALTATQYMAYARTGDRNAFELPYFQRRRKLCAAALGACLDGNAADLDAVVDGIWTICEESSWVISAHNGAEHAGVEPVPKRLLPDDEWPYVDLFAAQTAMILSLTCQLLEGALDGVSPLIREKVRREIEWRIFIPFEERDDFWWMGFIRKDLCNWTPWIVSNVMLTACVWMEDRDRLCGLLERGVGMLDRYLEVLPADGGCDEGPGYWSMAGGALLDCLMLLEHMTGGHMTFWDDEKLRAVLRFPLNAWLGGDWFINFADCDARPAIPGERLECAGKKLGDPALEAFGAHFRQTTNHLDDTPQLWRLLNDLFNPSTKAASEPLPPEDVWLPELEVRLMRREGFTLAAKGGVNEGSHNHNDCGSFILLLDGVPEIVDAGNMTYTARTFSDERYTLWNTRGRNHNIPMIGPREQVNGWEKRAKAVQAEPEGLTLDMADAYPADAGIQVCRRRFILNGRGLTVEDDIQLDAAETVTEVLMLRNVPEIHEGRVQAGGIRVICDNTKVSVEEIPVDDPRMARNYPGSLWRVSLTAPAARRHQIKITIERNHP